MQVLCLSCQSVQLKEGVTIPTHPMTHPIPLPQEPFLPDNLPTILGSFKILRLVKNLFDWLLLIHFSHFTAISSLYRLLTTGARTQEPRDTIGLACPSQLTLSLRESFLMAVAGTKGSQWSALSNQDFQTQHQNACRTNGRRNDQHRKWVDLYSDIYI